MSLTKLLVCFYWSNNLRSTRPAVPLPAATEMQTQRLPEVAYLIVQPESTSPEVLLDYHNMYCRLLRLRSRQIQMQCACTCIDYKGRQGWPAYGLDDHLSKCLFRWSKNTGTTAPPRNKHCVMYFFAFRFLLNSQDPSK